jgi:lipopolysaccharide export system permease protein
MKVLTRYLLKAHIGPFLFAWVVLTGVILINTLAKEMAGLAGKGLPLNVVLEFFLLSLPANIALTLPMSVLVAVLYTFSTLAAENEITALKANGIDLRRIILPVVVVAGTIAGGMIWFNDRVLPAANYEWRMLMTDVAQTRPLLALREQTLNPIPTLDGRTPYYLEAAQIDVENGRLRQVAIYDVSNPDLSRTINADSAWMVFNEARTDLLITLYDGVSREIDFTQPEQFQFASFAQQTMRIDGVSQRLERSVDVGYRTDRDMTIGMMEERIDSLRQQVVQLRAGPAVEAGEEASVTDQAAMFSERQAQNLEGQIRALQVEIQKKYSIAVAALVFVLIGVPLALRFPHGGIGMVIAASLTIFAIYYVGLIGGETLGDEGYVPPVIAMWGTNLVFGFLGLLGLLRLGREQGTGRGRELPGWLRSLLGRQGDGSP